MTVTARQTRTAAVFGGNSEIAVATVAALATDGGLEHVVLAVRDPARATAAERLAHHGLRTTVTAFDADATDTHTEAVEAAFAAVSPPRSTSRSSRSASSATRSARSATRARRSPSRTRTSSGP